MINIMNYLFLFLYLVAFTVGFSTFLFSIVYYILERVMWLKYYLFFLCTFALLLFIRSLKLFTLFAIPSFIYTNIFNTIYLFALSIAMAFMLYVIPAFLYHFLSLKWKAKENIIFIGISILYFIISILGMLVNFAWYIISISIFYIFIIYIFAVGVKYYKNITDKMMAFIVKLFGIITLIIFPILISQLVFIKNESISDIRAIDITLPLFYIWWNFIMLGYFFWYFINIIGKKIVLLDADNNDMNNEKNRYLINLTKREKEIATFLIKGKSNKEISLILDISLNTVNNHVANIYEKLKIKNRVELVNKLSK